MAYTGYAITKILHVFFAVAWIGGMLLQNLVIMPIILKLSPAARGEFQTALAPLMSRYGNIVGGLTVLTGIGLISMDNPNGYSWSTLTTTVAGRLIAFSLVGALMILYLVNFAIKPTVKRLGQAMAELPPGEPPHQGLMLLQKRVVFSSRLALLIGVLVLVAMVGANVSPYA